MMSKRLRVVHTFLAVILAVLMIGNPLLAQAASAGAFNFAPAALYLDENFDYGGTAGDLVAVSGGAWVVHSGTTPIGYIPTSLSMSGYGSSDVGGAATIGSNSVDANRGLGGTYTTGDLYYAALINVASAGAGTYFMHFKDDSTFNFTGRLFAQDSGGNLRFGLSSSSSTASYATTNFAYGTTYLVAVKYSLDSGASALFVLDTYSEVEPATPLITSTGSILAVEAIAIRQANGGPVATIDGVRVGTTWEDAVGGGDAPGRFTISKTAPATVAIDADFTYTLVATNQTGELRSNVIITDSLPLSVTVGAISDGGAATGNVISWTVASLADGASVQRTVQVTAPDAATTLVNSDYGVWASDWLTRATGVAVQTQVEAPMPAILPIYDLQYTTIPGSGTYPSLYVDQIVTTTGTVCAQLSGGYIIADAPGPWNSLYIYNGNNAKPALGTEYLVRGKLLEYYGMTEFSYPGQLYLDLGDDVCAPTLLTAAQIPYNNAATSEPYESVIVEVHSITITSMTTNRALFTDSSGGIGAIGKMGYYPPNMAVGQQYVYVRGPVIYDFSEYRIMPPTAADIKLLDITPPTVTVTIPADGATDVSPHRPLYATFSEPVNAETLDAASFTLAGPDGAVMGAIAYNAATRQASFTPEAALAANSLHTATLTAAIEDLSENALIPYTWTFTTGPADETPPTILASIPAPDAVDFPLGADLVITFSESLKPETVIGANFTLAGLYGATPWDSVTYNDAEHRLTLNPRGLLLPQSVYTLTIAEAVVDWGNNPVPVAQRSWSFTTATEPEMFAYHGDLHNHTSYSDGSGTPDQAFSQARTAGLDFLAISDHSYSISDPQWLDTLAQAEAHTEAGAFVAIRGFEYTQGAEGHINVYNTVRHAVRSDTTATCTYCDYTPNLEAGVTVNGFYPWLANPDLEAVDDAGIIMMFNHPGWMNFNDWTYHPEVEHLAQLEEVGNGTGTSYFFSFDEWLRSLDYGWKVGATNNSDTHRPNWGEATPHRTGIVAPELTKRAIFDAMHARRTFATEDSNYEIFFKANGYWMGAELPNTGEIAFEISFNDPDGETTTLLELYTNHGVVREYFQPNQAAGEWNFTLEALEPGVHYFFIKATQEDGDRIVTSPVWTMGVEDVSISDLTIQPTIPTIYNPSLLTARVTNRGLTAQTLTVTFEVDGVVIGEVPVTVDVCISGPCTDAFAQIAWQPTEVGPVEFTVTLQGAPAEDNPLDNTRSLTLNVTDEKVPLILIDGGHNNIGISPREVSSFVADMTYHGYNVLFNLDEITASDLNTETVRLLVINAYGPQQFTADEIAAIADFVAAGGSLWLNGVADYAGKVPWADTTADRFNELLAAIEVQVGHNIPMRMNDDQVADGNNNNGYKWGVIYHLFPSAATTGIGVNVEGVQTWSICSLMSRDRGPLTPAALGPNGFMMVQGDLDEGSSSGAHYSNTLNRTHNTDEDSWGDAYIYPATIPLAGAAGYDIPGAGRIFMYGDSNDAFNTFAYVAGDGKQNELFNLQTVMWLLGDPLQKRDIADVRPVENLHTLVWIEGVVTAAYGEFFNVLYVQDETGGITVHAPAGDIYAADYIRGKRVRVVGTIAEYQGDMEIEFFEAEMVQVIGEGVIPAPLPLTTAAANLFENQGWLVEITGTVLAISPELDTLWVDDGSGPIRAFLDGYNGTWAGIEVGDYVSVRGLTSADGEGPRIRVRHYQNDTRPDDLTKLDTPERLTLAKSVTPLTGVFPGDEVTYTLVLENISVVPVSGIALTDVLPWEVNFVAWVNQAGAAVNEDVITWAGELVAEESLTISFRAAVRSDSFFIAHPVVNTATFTVDGLPGGAADATFDLGGIVAPTLTKNVETPEPLYPGDSVTYTLVLANQEGLVGGVLLTDVLPSEVSFGSWIEQNGASVSDGVITWSGDLEPFSTRTFSFKATLLADAALYEETITNTVQATAANVEGLLEAEAAFTVDAQPQEPLLRLTKAVQTAGEPMPGDSVVYTLILANLGGGDAEGVLLTDTLPTALAFAGWLAQNDAEVSADVITWSGDLVAGASQTIIFTATLDTDPELHGQTITNVAQATADNAADVTGEVAFTVAGSGIGDVSLMKTVVAAAKVEADGVVTYTLTLHNSGSDVATGVLLTDVLPSEVDFGAWVAQNGADESAGVLTWSGDIAVHETVTIIFTVIVRDDVTFNGREVVNTATFTSANAGSGSDQAGFTLYSSNYYIFLPLVMRLSGTP